MKRSFQKLLRKLLRWSERNQNECVPVAESDEYRSIEYAERQIARQEKTIQWTLTPARGGYILIVTHFADGRSKYDEDKQTTLYTISDDKNLGETVSKLINLSQISY